MEIKVNYSVVIFNKNVKRRSAARATSMLWENNVDLMLEILVGKQELYLFVDFIISWLDRGINLFESRTHISCKCNTWLRLFQCGGGGDAEPM